MEFQAAPTQHLATLETDSAPTINGENEDISTPSDHMEGKGSEKAAFYMRTTGVDWEPSDENGDTVPVYNHPLSHPLELFSFQDRLKLIAKQLMQYSGMYPLSDQMREIAEELYHN